MSDPAGKLPRMETQGQEVELALREVRKQLGQLLASATEGQHRYVVTSNGRKVGAIIGLGDLEVLRRCLRTPPRKLTLEEEVRERIVRLGAAFSPRSPEENEIWLRMLIEMGAYAEHHL